MERNGKIWRVTLVGFADIFDIRGDIEEVPKINPRFLTSRNRSLEISFTERENVEI